MDLVLLERTIAARDGTTTGRQHGVCQPKMHSLQLFGATKSSSSSKLAMVLAWKSAKDMSPRRRVIMLGLIFLRRVQNSKFQAFQFLGPHRMVEGRQFGTSMLTMPAATGRHHFLWQSPEQTVEGYVGRRCVKDKRWACWEGGGGYFIRFMGKDCGLGSGLMLLNQLGCLPTSTLGQSYNENRCRWVREDNEHLR